MPRRSLASLARPAVVALVLGGSVLGGGVLGGNTVSNADVTAVLPPTGVAITLQNVATGTHADVSGGQMREGQQILEWNYQNAPNQQWRLTRSGTSHKIRSVANDSYCLVRHGDAARHDVVLGACDSHRADWDIDWAGPARNAEKYRIKDPAGASSLNVGSRTPSPGRGLVTSADHDHDGARWFLTDVDVTRRATPADPRLDQATFLTTHNAMANTDEGFWGRFPNQSYGLRSQLDQGVRGMQLDVRPYRGDVRMCHGGCWGNERTFTWGLQQVVDFLNADRGAIVTLFLEDYTSVDELRAAVSRVNGLTELLFRPDRGAVRANGWPKLSQLVSSNRRLLIFSQRPGREDFGVMYDRDWTAENYWTLGGSGGNTACYSRWSDVPLSKEESGFVRLHVMNHYRDVPWESSAHNDNGGKLRTRVERICGPAARRKPNYVAVDFFQRYEGGTSPLHYVATMNTYW